MSILSLCATGVTLWNKGLTVFKATINTLKIRINYISLYIKQTTESYIEIDYKILKLMINQSTLDNDMFVISKRREYYINESNQK